MSLLKRLFGSRDGATPTTAPAEEHKGFTIHPDPINEGGRWRIGARIEKETGGEIKTHRMIRADTLESRAAAVDASLGKARMLIDQQGEEIFR
ncbi:HlyU family transcriptional regulator [Marivita sp. GX14005]|uniref:HlyU family transcriptional regulator n=1 Tax=Marivita sp. GX14005 TaxID=2942276 RepID=UPI002019460A|nr:HlyU family transcriptional regulator [Marivita sp. GX14005]MCL3881167.1 HlyU family transcriptional regulator [Marivita sp. GX14005]